MGRFNQTPSRNRPVEIMPPPDFAPPPARYVSGAPSGFESWDDSESEGGLLEYVRILLRHKKAILLSAAAGLILGFAVGIPMEPVFRARTSLEVLNLNEDFMNMKQSNPVTTNGNSAETSEEQTQAKLLQSDALIARVFEKLDPDAPKAPVKRRMALSGWRSWLHKPEPLPVTPRQELLNRAAHSLKVRPTPHTRVLEVTIDSTDPKLAADFANTLVQESAAQSLEARWSTAHKTGEWLSREIEDARVKLRNSEDALQTYARNSGLIFTDETTNVVTERLQQVQQELSAATADRIAKQSRYEQARNSSPESLADVLNDPGLRETAAKIKDLRRQIADLSSVFTADYSKVRRLQAELSSLQAAYDRDRQNILSRIGTDYREAIVRENLLSAAYERQTQAVTGQGEKEIQYNILKREADSSRQLYDTMLQQMKQSSMASAMHASNVRVVDPAEVPDKPAFPLFLLNSALGLFAGLSFSMLAVLIRHHSDRSLQQPGDVRHWTDLPELGTIPSASAVINKRTLRDANRGKGSLPAPDRSRSVALATLQRPSLFAEAFRSALTSILFAGANGSRPRVLVFTSANASDGKTTAVSNLAISSAEIGGRILIIDADMRQPRMHQIFEVPNDRGLSDLLASEFTEEDLAGIVHQTNVPGVHLLTAGPATHAATHLLHSANLALLLNACKKQYDMILIDTPPMLQMADARVAGRVADAVVLIARAGDTSRDALNAANERLAEDRIRVLGTILNDWDPTRSAGDYYREHASRCYSHYQGK